MPLEDLAPTAEHRQFLNRYYRLSRHIYDLTRKYYLFGRDRALAELAIEPWQRLIEVGPGTGRNLRKLHQQRPRASFGGVEAADEMLQHARRRLPFARLVSGFAEDVDYPAVLGAAPQRILFSYCLSMVQDRQRALRNARQSLTADGEVVVVDFADCLGLPPSLRAAFLRYLELFRVRPIDPALLAGARSVYFGPFRYFVIARYVAG
jgi:S-adenosylmethionine-diacylgycerolhomoserine-N-methlytransferase